MRRGYIGIDNGVSGSIGFVVASLGMREQESFYFEMPTISTFNYTKTASKITRIDHQRLFGLLSMLYEKVDSAIVILERPYVNPKGFKATVSGVRALEATLICVERMELAYQYVDSKEWQKELLPSGLKGAELKHASLDVGIRLFFDLEEEIKSQKDADGLLIAEWARRRRL